MVLGSGRRRLHTEAEVDTGSSNDVDSQCGEQPEEPDLQEQEDVLESWVEWLKRTTRDIEQDLGA